MTARPPARRPAFTLIEVLTALFLLAVGLILLLTLFPYGALQMGQALKHDRCTQAAEQGDTAVRRWWQLRVCEAPGTEPYDQAGQELALGRPVLVDPVGVASGLNGTVGGAGAIPRKTTNDFGGTLSNALAACAMPDDITFADTPTPELATGGVVRQGRYHWAAMLQKPNPAARPNVADLTVLVFDGRPPGVANPNAETTVAATFDATSATIATPPDQLNVRANGWVMDGTASGATALAKFYRVRSINRSGTGSVIEFDTTNRIAASAGGSYTGTLYIYGGLAEVFTRPQLTPSAWQQQTP